MKGKFFENLSEILNRSCYSNKFQAIQMNAKIIHTALLCGFVYVHYGSHTTFFSRTTLTRVVFLHIGQYRGKLIRTVSSLTFVLVLLWQIGQCTQYKVGLDFVISILSYVVHCVWRLALLVQICEIVIRLGRSTHGSR